MKKSLFLLTLFSSCVNAASFSIPLPNLNGNYIYPDGSPTEFINFGTQFSSIQSAKLHIEASGTAGLIEICNGLQCITQSHGLDLLWGFNYESGHNLVFGSQNLTTTLATYTFDITSKSSFLLDGIAQFYIEQNFLITIPEATITILQPSSFQISNVVLNVEGTVVPVPPSALLLISGLTSLFLFRLKKNKYT
jgi:hypothetical protein